MLDGRRFPHLTSPAQQHGFVIRTSRPFAKILINDSFVIHNSYAFRCKSFATETHAIFHGAKITKKIIQTNNSSEN